MTEIDRQQFRAFCSYYLIDMTKPMLIRGIFDKSKGRAETHWHTDTEESWEALEYLQTRGMGLHTPINIFEGRSPSSKGGSYNILGYRAFVVDFDYEPDYVKRVTEYPTKPTFITTRGKSRRGHAHWCFAEPIQSKSIDWCDIQTRLAIALGGQPYDMIPDSRLCRLPGTWNFKGEEPAQIQIIEGGIGEPYEAKELYDYLNTSLDHAPVKGSRKKAKGLQVKAITIPDDDRLTALKVYLRVQMPPADDGMDRYLYKIAAKACALGVLKEIALPFLIENASKSQRYNEADTQAKTEYLTAIDNGYNHAQQGFGGDETLPVALALDEGIIANLQHTAKGEIKKSLANIKVIATQVPFFKGLYKFNSFTERLEMARDPAPLYNRLEGRGEVTDNDERGFREFMSEACHMEISKENSWTAIYRSAMMHQHDPLKDWLDTLVWDKQPRLRSWLTDYCSAEATEFIKWAGMSFLVAAVARVYVPGTKYDHLLVLEGAENLGKSTVFSILGGQYYVEQAFDRTENKDYLAILDQNWIVEIGEMAGMYKIDQRSLKMFISQTAVEYRSPYDRVTMRHQRHYVLAGTTNQSHYLASANGNRRFLPVRVGTIDMVQLRKDRDQLFAEAKALWRNNFPLAMPSTVIRLAQREQDMRRLPNDWEDPIVTFILKEGVGAWTYKEMWQLGMLRNDELEGRNKKQLGRVLEEVGGVFKKVSKDGVRVKAWSFDQIALSGLRAKHED